MIICCFDIAMFSVYKTLPHILSSLITICMSKQITVKVNTLFCVDRVPFLFTTPMPIELDYKV